MLRFKIKTHRQTHRRQGLFGIFGLRGPQNVKIRRGRFFAIIKLPFWREAKIGDQEWITYYHYFSENGILGIKPAVKDFFAGNMGYTIRSLSLPFIYKGNLNKMNNFICDVAWLENHLKTSSKTTFLMNVLEQFDDFPLNLR